MSEDEKNNQQSNISSGGGGTGPVSGVGGMSSAERVHYIQEVQKTSPLSRIVDAVKNVKLADLGLSRALFDQRAGLLKKFGNIYSAIREKKEINQHIAGLTENVNGIERLKHEMDPVANVNLIDGKDVDKKKGLFVDVDLAPKKCGEVE